MTQRFYIGYVIRKLDNEKVPVSASSSRRAAGEAMETWIDEQDPQQLDYKVGAVFANSVPLVQLGEKP
ncbi:hypothetical protein H6F86_20995 [Phormidium sp. FACHB-592]|uniref:Uncharacterized protein n=1 Tax=Stenomitos frigidus AS-A4 TaxID=2933935 RepID=A0ABV0KEN9_9CYAN|nr:hypothetical protein [Phormidium sp. FACHB-592]MBD2076312.1 hypothetical protein [Phormidium sp. FACHB-592]